MNKYINTIYTFKFTPAMYYIYTHILHTYTLSIQNEQIGKKTNLNRISKSTNGSNWICNHNYFRKSMEPITKIKLLIINSGILLLY